MTDKANLPNQLPFSVPASSETELQVALHPDPGHLVGLVVKASILRVEGPGFESPLRHDFLGRVIPVT